MYVYNWNSFGIIEVLARLPKLQIRDWQRIAWSVENIYQIWK